MSRLPTNPDTYRFDDIHILDARLEKEFTFSDFGFTLGVDCFNVFNKGYIQQRNHRLQVGASATNPFAPASDYVTEVTSPRIFRLGARSASADPSLSRTLDAGGRPPAFFFVARTARLPQ